MDNTALLSHREGAGDACDSALVSLHPADVRLIALAASSVGYSVEEFVRLVAYSSAQELLTGIQRPVLHNWRGGQVLELAAE